MAEIRRMFPGGNTSQGFYSLHDNIIGKNKKILYILKGMPGGGKSSLMKEIGRRATKEGYSVEYHHCPSDPNSIDGVVVIELGVGIVDGTPPHSIDPKYPGLTDRLVDLTRFIDTTKLQEYGGDIKNAKSNNKIAYRKAFNYFRGARCIYEEIEDSNRGYVDIRKKNDAVREFSKEIFETQAREVENRGFVVRRLFSAAYTPEGYVDYTEHIIRGVGKIYYISGDIGTGKSEFLHGIMEETILRNYHIEIYHDPLIPERIESVFIPEIDTIISSNISIKGFSNHILDFNDFFDNSHIEQEDYGIYRELMDRGIGSLKIAKKNHSILENIYKTTVNYEGINMEREKIWKEIEKVR